MLNISKSIFPVLFCHVICVQNHCSALGFPAKKIWNLFKERL
eukprot:UN07694